MWMCLLHQPWQGGEVRATGQRFTNPCTQNHILHWISRVWMETMHSLAVFCLFRGAQIFSQHRTGKYSTVYLLGGLLSPGPWQLLYLSALLSWACGLNQHPLFGYKTGLRYSDGHGWRLAAVYRSLAANWFVQLRVCFFMQVDGGFNWWIAKGRLEMILLY